MAPRKKSTTASGAGADADKKSNSGGVLLAAIAAYCFMNGSGGAAPSAQPAAVAGDAFDLSAVEIVESGTHEQLPLPSEGGPGGSTYRITYRDRRSGAKLSPWHDVPLHAKRRAGAADDAPVFHFVCEIPLRDARKMEVNKEEPHNPIAQDVKKGKLREYKYVDPIYGAGSTVNYGALSQTWEDPDIPHPDTGVGGDNDPIDVLQINDTPCRMGEIMPVRVLGTLALVDGGETDWKLIVVDDRDEATRSMRDIADVPNARVSQLREWFRLYKTAEGKGENAFGLDERAMDAAYALRVVEETHAQWKALFGPTATRQCTSGGQPCWVSRR